MQIQISWLLQKKPTDLDLHCLQRQGISGLSRTRVKALLSGKIQKITNWWHFSYFSPRNKDLIFHANYLSRILLPQETICMKCLTVFSRKIRLFENVHVVCWNVYQACFMFKFIALDVEEEYSGIFFILFLQKDIVGTHWNLTGIHTNML